MNDTATNQGNEYVVFKDVGTTGTKSYELVAVNVWATNRENAIRKALADDAITGAGEAGTYVAVPARSWKPLKVTVNTQTVVNVG